jgi:hypothetical protein
MPRPPLRVLCATLLPVVGFCAGWLYARHVVALMIAYARARWGYVCGNGLEMPFYFWPPVGAVLGFASYRLLWWCLGRKHHGAA